MVDNEHLVPRAVAEELFGIAFGVDLVRGCDSEVVEELLLLCVSAITVHQGNQREVMRFLWNREIELQEAWERSTRIVDDVLYDSESKGYPARHKVSFTVNGCHRLIFEQTSRKKPGIKPRLASTNDSPRPARVGRRGLLTVVK